MHIYRLLNGKNHRSTSIFGESQFKGESFCWAVYACRFAGSSVEKKKLIRLEEKKNIYFIEEFFFFFLSFSTPYSLFWVFFSFWTLICLLKSIQFAQIFKKKKNFSSIQTDSVHLTHFAKRDKKLNDAHKRRKRRKELKFQT